MRENLLDKLAELLRQEEKFVSEGKLLKNKIIESALKLDPQLIKLLLSDETFKKHFFTTVEDITVFDKEKFLKFVSNKQFLPDSYTAFKNKIGLAVGDDKYFYENHDVVINFPYKDCVLVGGQDKEDSKRNEIFWNYTLAPEQVDTLLEPKVFTNIKKYTANGVEEVDKIQDTDNLIIKGNNLFALHSLKKRFAGRVKLIYIDPPYNTGSDSFNYNDSFNHSTWLTFMKNRLEVAKELLSKDGVIFVQCDYIEFAYLKVLMDEIFGKDKALPHINIKTATPAGFKVVNPGLVNVSEHILIYALGDKSKALKVGYTKASYQTDYNKVLINKEENIDNWKFISIKEAVLKELGFENEKQFNDSYPKQIRTLVLKEAISEFAIKNADKVFATYGPHKPSPKLKEGIKRSKENPTKIISVEREDGGKHYLLNGRLLAFYSSKLKNIEGELTPTQRLTDFWSDISWDSIANEGGVTLKNGKKPEKLLKRIIELATEEGDIVLDYHLGSGTTAAVAHKLNRQYIGIEQLDYGENDSVVRLQNVINGDTSGISKIVGWKGGGSFVYMELFELNKKFERAIEECETKEQAKEIFEDMLQNAILDYSFDLSKADEIRKFIEESELPNIKKLLFSLLDPNHMYLNYSEIEDETYNVSEKDKKINKSFYEEK